MLECWDEDQSQRPSFAKLKELLNQFMQDNCHFIHFSMPDGSYDTLSEPPYHPEASSTFSDFLSITPIQANGVVLPGYDSLAARRGSSPAPQDLLIVSHPSVRQHLSAPSFDSEREGEEGEVGVLKRTYSNPYVRTPKHDSKNYIRRSFEWMITPEITVQSEDGEEEKEGEKEIKE